MNAAFEGLGYADTLPLGFERLAELPGSSALAGINLENQQLLIADASLDEQRPLADKKLDEEHELADDLQRLEYKVNVLIQLVAQLLKRDGNLPPVRSVRVHALGLEWLLDGDEVLPGVGIVSLHVSRHFPQALRLPGRIVETREVEDGRWVRFAFEGLSPPVIELMERLVFRHHRRLVAGSRSASRG